MNLNLCISNGTASTKIYDKLDDFDFDIHVVNFPFLDGDVPGVPHMGYIYQLTRFARASSNLSDFNCRNKKALTAKLLRQGYRYFILVGFIRRFRKFIVDAENW